MSENANHLSNRALLSTGISFVAILVIGIILFYTGLNEGFYSSNSTVQAIFKAITYLGEPVVFLVLVLIFYLGYNKKFAKNLLLSLLTSFYLNQWLKSILKDPRPSSNIDLSEEYLLTETSYGFPSGHSQNAVGFWGYLGFEFKERVKVKEIPVIPLLLSILVFLVAISRIVTGVHDIHDITGGLLIGMAILLAFIYLEPTLTGIFNKMNFTMKIIVTVLISVILFLLGTLIYPTAGMGLVSTSPLYPDSGAFGTVGGVILGFGIGYIIENEYVKYDPSQLTNNQKVINILLGIVIALIIFIPLEYLLVIDSVFYRFARYAVLSFILAYVVPLICTKIKK